MNESNSASLPMTQTQAISEGDFKNQFAIAAAEKAPFSKTVSAGASFLGFGGAPAQSAQATDANLEGQQSESAMLANADVAEHLDAFGNVVTPRDYIFPAITSQLPDGVVETTHEQRAAIRREMAKAGVPAGVGNLLVLKFNAALTGPRLTQEQRALKMQETRATLIQRHGSEDAALQVMNDASELFNRITAEQTWVSRTAAMTAFGADPWIIESLANVARARKGAK